MGCLKERFSPLAILLILSLSVAVQASGAQKERTFDGTYDTVWNACVRAANQEFTLEHSEKESGVLSFRTGASLTSWGFRVGITVTEIDENRVRIAVNPQKTTFQFAWGAGDRITNKYFAAIYRVLSAGERSRPTEKKQ